jgi:hypothetical protein
VSDSAISNPAPSGVRFSKRALGGVSVVVGLLLLGVLIYAVSEILPLLTKTPGFIEKRMQDQPDLNLAYVATLEYESFAIRMQGSQVALGFLVGLVLGVFGLLLFAIGATDAFEAAGSTDKASVSLKSTAPGLIVLGISGLVITFAVSKDLHRSFEASYDQSKVPKIKSEQLPPPRSGKGINTPGADE